MGHHGGGKAIIERCITDEHLLKEEIIDDVPDDHRPEDKYMAKRLKVEHEFRTRFSSKVQRELKRSAAGGVQQPGDEIWMHFKTSDDDVAAFVENERVTEGEAKKEAVEELRDEDEVDFGEESNDGSEDRWLGQPPLLKAGNGT